MTNNNVACMPILISLFVMKPVVNYIL